MLMWSLTELTYVRIMAVPTQVYQLTAPHLFRHNQPPVKEHRKWTYEYVNHPCFVYRHFPSR